MKKKWYGLSFLLVLVWLFITAFILNILFKYVDLKPQVTENFFFSSEDPQFKQDKMISELFPQPSFIIMGVQGSIDSESYMKKMRVLSHALLQLDEVFEVQSLTHGPKSFKDALKSPLWKRILIAEDGKASLVSVFIRDVPMEAFIKKLEDIRDELTVPSFKILLSGAPYITELIRRYLLRDLKIFSASAFAVFGLLLFIFFRSGHVLIGTLVSCVNASALTLIIGQILHIGMGPLTANISTIVFVLTLSQIVFITYNWYQIREKTPPEGINCTAAALKETWQGSLWSMITTFLGFLSLLFVQAAPLQQFGISGALGTGISLICAYLIYPVFLQWAENFKIKTSGLVAEKTEKTALISRIQNWIAIPFLLLAFGLSVGLWDINTDPSLLSYFKKGSELRQGLEYIDRNGGSSLLKIVVADKDDRVIDTEVADQELAQLHVAMEKHVSVGNVVSLPLLLAEAKRVPIASLMPIRWIINILDSPQYGEVAKYFVTSDRKKTLFMLRIKESERPYARSEVIDQILSIINYQGYVPLLVGGVFSLQAKLSELLTQSLISGLTLLLVTFTLMGLFISRSWKITMSLVVSLCVIPLTMLGILGLCRIPLDIISSPAANLAIGMGVDAMIHMMVHFRRIHQTVKNAEEAWILATNKLWKPVLTSMIVICSGFGIFSLSTFPPTERFGISVVIGSILSPFAALILLPYISYVGHHRRAQQIQNLSLNL